MNKKEMFLTVYTVNLSTARAMYPNDYHFTAEEVPNLAKRMTESLANGHANKDSHAIRWTCKELGIKHTYQAIRDYLNS